jgi:N-methylhydantoinase A
MGDTGLKLETARFQRLADGRFLGQGFDLVVDLPDGPYDGRDADAVRRALTAAFEKAYREKFSLTPPDVPVEFINIRVAVRAPVAGSEVVLRGHSRRAESPVKGRRPVWLPEAVGFVDTVVYDRARLSIGDRFSGPAVIEEEGSTLVVPPRARFAVAPTGNVIVSLDT